MLTSLIGPSASGGAKFTTLGHTASVMLRLTVNLPQVSSSNYL